MRAERVYTCSVHALLPKQKPDCIWAALGAGWNFSQEEFKRDHV